MRFSTTIVLGALAMTSSILALPMNVASDDVSLVERSFADLDGDVLEVRENPRLIETKTYKNGRKTIVKKTYARVVRVQAKPPIKKAVKTKVQKKKSTSNSKTQKKSTSNSKAQRKPTSSPKDAMKVTTSNAKGAKVTTTTTGSSKPTGSSKVKAKVSPSPTPSKGAKVSSTTTTTHALKPTGSAHKNKAAASATTTPPPQATAPSTTTTSSIASTSSPAVAQQTPSGDDWNHRHGNRYFDRPSRYDRYHEGRRIGTTATTGGPLTVTAIRRPYSMEWPILVLLRCVSVNSNRCLF